MDQEKSTFMPGAIAAVVLAGVIVGLVLLRNWFAYEVVSRAVTQPAYAFPTAEVKIPELLTPFAITTPLFEPGMFDWATPTPNNSDIYITSP